MSDECFQSEVFSFILTDRDGFVRTFELRSFHDGIVTADLAETESRHPLETINLGLHVCVTCMNIPVHRDHGKLIFL